MNYNDYVPRDEFQLCKLFEDLLFMRTEQFMSEEEQRGSKSLRLSEKDIQLLNKTGILNRIFRRWFQTTWGYKGNSKHFQGETPRQELSQIYPELNQGKAFFSVKLVKQDENWKIIPFYFSKKILRGEKGAFKRGLENLKKEKNLLVAPQYDPEFGAFIDWLRYGERAVRRINPKKRFKNEYIKYWMLFLELAPTNLLLNCQMKLTEQERTLVCFAFRDCLFDFFSSQPKGEDNYLEIDKIIFQLWKILRKVDKDLPTFEYMTALENDEEKTEKNEKFRRVAEIFYRLGVAFDRYVLFPIDRYFGKAEIVWTGQKNFFNDLLISSMLLKKNLKIKETKAQRKFSNAGDIIGDIRYLWFAPPTLFRLLGSAFRYFH